MAQENPTWGQARIAVELVQKLGIQESPRSVRKYPPMDPNGRAGGESPRSAGPPLSATTLRLYWPVISS
jgi:hypothetical protein